MPSKVLVTSFFCFQIHITSPRCFRAMAAITNPTVNSYKRINPGVTVSGSTWAPTSISYTGNNRTHMIRFVTNVLAIYVIY